VKEIHFAPDTVKQQLVWTQ